MQIHLTQLPGVLRIEPKIFGDSRGFFLESYNRKTFAELGLGMEFVQDNHSRSSHGVLRGLHYQLQSPQAKLIRCIQGEIFDVAVDIRRDSPHFGQWVAARLSAENRQMMFVPEGFAHGFCVLSEVAEVIYKCTDFYVPQQERGIHWRDPRIAIDWPLEENQAMLSEKDCRLPMLDEMPTADLPMMDAIPCES